MNQVIEKDGILYALMSPSDNTEQNKSEWFGKETSPLQGSRMRYNAGKSFKTHQHKLNPRIINYTQEAFIVIKGKIQIDVYTRENKEQLAQIFLEKGIIDSIEATRYGINHLGSLVAEAGDVIFIWKGYHKLTVLEDDSNFYEIKSGQFTSVQEDKEFLPQVDS